MMLAKGSRVLAFVVLGAVGVWWGRLVAHSKVPPPEGRWREVSEDSLK
jgi:hypothetical protein